MYVNGVQRKTSGDFPIGGTIFTGGAMSLGSGRGTQRGVNEDYDGKMDQFRLSNISRYPNGTTFAVPTPE